MDKPTCKYCRANELPGAQIFLRHVRTYACTPVRVHVERVYSQFHPPSPTPIVRLSRDELLKRYG